MKNSYLNYLFEQIKLELSKDSLLFSQSDFTQATLKIEHLKQFINSRYANTAM